MRVFEGWVKEFCCGKAKVDWTECWGNSGDMLVITGFETERGLGVGGMDTSNGWENTRIFAAGGISIPG